MYIRYKISHNISIYALKRQSQQNKFAIVVFGNVLEASLTICADQTVPDVEESDLGPHDLPVCLYAADNFSRCHFQMQFLFAL